MCTFCNSDIIREEKEKGFIEKCDNCGGKITILKKNNRKIVIKYPKKDFLWNVYLFFPLFLIGILLLIILLGNRFFDIKTEYIINSFLIGVIILVAIMVICSIMNIRNFKKSGYMYIGLKTIVTKEEGKSRIIFSKIYNWFILFFGLQFIVVMSFIIQSGILYK